MVSSIRTRIMTAPYSGPLATLRKKPKHAGAERGGVTEDFVMESRGPARAPRQACEGPWGPVRACQGGSERPKEDTKKKKR
jgi:hypothetical protein